MRRVFVSYVLFVAWVVCMLLFALCILVPEQNPEIVQYRWVLLTLGVIGFFVSWVYGERISSLEERDP